MTTPADPPAQHVVRSAADDADRALLEALGVSDAAASSDYLLLERAGLAIAAGCLTIGWTPEEPEHPTIRLFTARSTTPDDLTALLRALIEQARVRGSTRLLIGCDPMHHDLLRMLDRLGFAPTGRGPYHLLGGGLVRYVTGYEDATGSTLDMALSL